MTSARMGRASTSRRPAAAWIWSAWQLGPQELFDEDDAHRAMRNLEFVSGLCERLLAEFSAS